MLLLAFNLTIEDFIMNKNLMADIDESRAAESDIDDLDYDVKEAMNSSGWIELEIPCSPLLKDSSSVE